jgi:hypothetical protein
MRRAAFPDGIVKKTAGRGLWIHLAIASAMACVLAVYFLVKAKAFVTFPQRADDLVGL